MQAWTSFYSTLGGAAATLLGLLFVAVSVNAGAALGPKDALTRDMTEQAFQNYLAVLLVALLALFPQLDSRLFGLICLGSVGARAGWLALRIGRTFHRKTAQTTLMFALRRHLAAVVGFGLLIFAASRMALGHADELHTLAAATLVLMLSGVTVSWELLRRIALAG